MFLTQFYQSNSILPKKKNNRNKQSTAEESIYTQTLQDFGFKVQNAKKKKKIPHTEGFGCFY